MTAPLGLYSISVRGLTVPHLLTWAAEQQIPFVHLRGGPRGCDLARRSAATVRAWRAAADATVPITGVTAEVEVAALVAADPVARSRAWQEIGRLAEAAGVLGAGWVRLLGRTPPDRSERLPDAGLLAGLPVPLLVEPHHAAWLQPDGLARLLGLADAGIRLLADTAQLASGFPGAGVPDWLGPVLGRSDVLHLHEEGGEPGHGQAVAAAAASRIGAGQPLQAALEWTGADRSPAACLARYREASRRWSAWAKHQPPA